MTRESDDWSILHADIPVSDERGSDLSFAGRSARTTCCRQDHAHLPTSSPFPRLVLMSLDHELEPYRFLQSAHYEKKEVTFSECDSVVITGSWCLYFTRPIGRGHRLFLRKRDGHNNSTRVWFTLCSIQSLTENGQHVRSACNRTVCGGKSFPNDPLSFRMKQADFLTISRKSDTLIEVTLNDRPTSELVEVKADADAKIMAGIQMGYGKKQKRCFDIMYDTSALPVPRNSVAPHMGMEPTPRPRTRAETTSATISRAGHTDANASTATSPVSRSHAMLIPPPVTSFAVHAVGHATPAVPGPQRDTGDHIHPVRQELMTLTQDTAGQQTCSQLVEVRELKSLMEQQVAAMDLLRNEVTTLKQSMEKRIGGQKAQIGQLVQEIDRLKENSLVACATSSWLANAFVSTDQSVIWRNGDMHDKNYIFRSLPFDVGSCISFRIEDMDTTVRTSLTFGVTVSSADHLDLQSLPASGLDLWTKTTSLSDFNNWNVVTDLISDPRIKMEFRLMREESGVFFKSMSEERLLFPVDQYVCVFPFFLFDGCVQAIRLKNL